MNRGMTRIERHAKNARVWSEVKHKRLLRHLNGDSKSIKIPFTDEAIADENLPEFEEMKESDEAANPSFWMRGKRYKRGQRRKYINGDFIDWIASASEITISDSCLNIQRRHGEWGGLDIFYRKLGMRPGGKYRLSVKLKHNRETKYEDKNGEHYVAFGVICGKSYDRHGVFTSWYSDVYSMVWTAGQTPAGAFEEVSCEIDFTGLAKIPGFVRIQTAPTYDGQPPCDISLDWLKVEDMATNAVVYCNDFDYGSYKARGDVTSETPPPENETEWEEIDE